MKRLVVFLTIGLESWGVQSQAQFGSGIVFDPTQSVHAIAQISQYSQRIEQAQQLYTTTMQTRDTIISTYNLAQQMANLPSLLYQQYLTPWANWTNFNAGNTYGNVQGWVNSANNGFNVGSGYSAATINNASKYPLYGNLDAASQQLVAAQGATSDLSDGIAQSNLQTLGTIRANSEAREADIQQLQSETYSSDPSEHTDMATLQRINQATLMQLRAQQDANQIAQAAALQQMIAQKQQQDALKAAFNDAAAYQQRYNTTVVPLTSGYGNSMSQTH